MKTARTTFTAHLKNKGLNFTAERRKVLEAVFSLHRHFDFDELYDALRKRNARVSRATIYRTLPLLIESGLIREVFRHTNRPHYEHVFGHDHHDHMLCVRCGKYIEFKDDRIEEMQERVCARYGFTPIEHKLGIKGYCSKCRAGAGKKPSRKG